MPPWIREALDGYRWLWRAHLRWSRGPLWLAGLGFALRVVDDLGRAALAALEAGAIPRTGAVPVGISIEGRKNMALPHSDPASVSLGRPANERFKAGFDSWLWISMIVATAIHFSTFAFWPEMTAIVLPTDPTEPTYLEPPPDVNIPEAPEMLDKPALPIPASVDVPDDATIGVTTLEGNPVGELPPPPRGVPSAVADSNGFTPTMLRPRVLNADEVVRAMRREYPAVLRDAGIGGTVSVTFSLDEDGKVLDTAIGQSSGYEALDRAALAVAEVIRFSPARNRDLRVAVRAAFPIVFRVDGGR